MDLIGVRIPEFPLLPSAVTCYSYSSSRAVVVPFSALHSWIVNFASMRRFG